MLRKLVVLCMLAALVPAAVLAQTHRKTARSTHTRSTSTRTHQATRAARSGSVVTSWGPRFGFSSTPDQVVVGGELNMHGPAPNWAFTPNLELGFGDNATVFAINGDLKYLFDVRGSNMTPYLGAGITLNHTSVSNTFPVADFSSTDFGGNVIGGVQIPTRTGGQFFTEARIGMGDNIPDFKLMAGFKFRM